MRRSKLVWSIPVGGLALTLIFAGCGGNDSGRAASARFSSFNPTVRAQQNAADAQDAGKNIPVFMVNNSKIQAKHLWVQLYEVKINTHKSPVTVFSDPKGLHLDLCSLYKNGKSSPLFLGCTHIGTKEEVIRVHLVVGKTFHIQKAGTQHEKGTFASQTTAPKDRATLQLEIPSRAKFSEAHPLILGLRLGRLAEAPDKETKLALKTESVQLIQNTQNQIPSVFIGEVLKSNGTGSNLTFTLKTRGNQKLFVNVTPHTKAFSYTGEQNPLITDGKIAQISGVYDFNKKAFLAQSIRVHHQKEDEHAITLAGRVQKINLTQGSILLKPQGYSRITPDSNNLIHLNIKEDTILLGEDGKALNRTEFTRLARPSSLIQAEILQDQKDHQLKLQWLRISGEKPTKPSSLKQSKAVHSDKSQK